VNETELFLGERPSWPTATLILDDVQALWGGQRLVVNGDGTAVLTTVAPGGAPQINQFSLSEDTIQRLLQLCVDVDLVTIVTPERLGVPDEARPTLTLVNGNGRQHTIAKWANDKAERFDAIYAALLQLAQGH
jgi:hypothetical protein